MTDKKYQRLLSDLKYKYQLTNSGNASALRDYIHALENMLVFAIEEREAEHNFDLVLAAIDRKVDV